MNDYKTKLLVITDSHFIKKEGIYYTNLQSDASFWQRYLDVFDELIVLGRVREADETESVDQYLVSSRAGVTFCDIPDFNGAKGLITFRQIIIKQYENIFNSIDAIIARVPGTVLTVLWDRIRKGDAPFAAEVVVNPATAFLSEKNPLIGKIVSGFFAKMTQDICLHATGVSYVTAHALQRQYPSGYSLGDSSKFESWYSTIDLDDSFYLNQCGRAKPVNLTVAFSGQMDNLRKGQDIFIKTIGILNARGLPVRAVMVGDGRMRQFLMDYCDSIGLHGIITFPGWITGTTQVQKYISKAEFFLLPSRSEGLPRCMIEAMASGVLCLCSGVDGTSELVSSRCIISDNSPEHYADVIESFYNNWIEYREELSRQFDTAFQFRSNNMRARRVQFYSTLLASTASKTRSGGDR